MKQPIFYTKTGRLTAYSFACGYVERRYIKKPFVRNDVSLYMEHNCYHVKGFDNGEFIWESFPVSEGSALRKARKYFNSIKLPLQTRK